MPSIGPQPSVGFDLVNGWDRGDVAYIALRDSQCRGTIDIGSDGVRRCPFQARYMMLGSNDGNGAVIGMCGHHASDLWLDCLDPESDREFRGRGLWDAREQECEVNLKTRSSLDAEDEDAHVCGDRATVLIRREDDETEFTACRRHAQPSWLEVIALDMDDVVETGEKVSVDA